MTIEYSYLLRFQKSLLLAYLSMTFIFNHLKPYPSIFRKCLYLLESNAGVLIVSILQSADYQDYIFLWNFANDGACRLVKRLLRKIRPILLDFIGCKDTHFSQMSQAFWVFSSFSKIIQYPDLPHFSQNPQNEALVKNSFFANDLDL